MSRYKKILNELKQIDKYRYKHSIGVMDTAVKLCKIYNEDIEKMKIAAILHDYAKIYSNEKLRELVAKFNLNLDDIIINTKDLAHGPVAAELIKNRFNIKDKKILNAIRYHTFTNRNMTDFDIILYLADMIEPNRANFKDKNKIRHLCFNKQLKKAMVVALNRSLKYIIDKNEKIYIESVILRNKLIDQI